MATRTQQHDTTKMWILPKSLTSRFVPGMEVSTSDSDAASLCAQSLVQRSKPSPARSFLRAWKAGNLTRLRFGAISSHSLGQSFVTEWISCLAVTPVNLSAQPGNDLEQKTQDIFGPTSQAEFKFFDQSSVSSRTSKDTLALDSEKSLESWKNLVTKRRGEYSARLNAARLISEKECLSWPSPVASEVRQGFQDRSRGMKGSQESLTTVVIKCGPHDPDNRSTHGSHPESWATPQAQDTGRSQEAYKAATEKRGGQMFKSLKIQVESWASPRTMTGGTCKNGAQHCDINSQAGGKLNPRWVETLMGLPVGWTMPSCSHPVTIEPTSCDFSATE